MKTKILYICMICMGMLSMLCGCGIEGKGAYVHITMVSIMNNSSHDIEIVVEKPSSVLMTGAFEVKSGGTFKIGDTAEGGYYPPSPIKAQIKFDDGTTITHHRKDGDNPHNFCSDTAFEEKMLGKRRVEYTFVFTDEDYEYAKKHADQTKREQ